MLHRIRLAMQTRRSTRSAAKLRLTKRSSAARRATCPGADARAGISETSFAGKAAVWVYWNDTATAAARVRTGHRRSPQARVRGPIDEHVEKGATVYSDALAVVRRLAAATTCTRSSTTPRRTSTAQSTRTGSKTSGAAQARNQRHVRSVEPFHLFRYLDEQAFRFNNRVRPERLRPLPVGGIADRRPTYHVCRAHR